VANASLATAKKNITTTTTMPTIMGTTTRTPRLAA
jgi:hypothetical protein